MHVNTTVEPDADKGKPYQIKRSTQGHEYEPADRHNQPNEYVSEVECVGH